MRKGLLYLYIIVFALTGKDVFAQDPQLSQYYAMQTYLNPAFAGGTHNNRAMLHYRLQWPDNQARYSTSIASFDTYFAKKKVGLGVLFMNDNQAAGVIKTNDVQLMASYELSINKHWTFRPGLQLGLTQRTLTDAFRYPSQNNGLQSYDPTISSGENIAGNRIYADATAGGLLYSETFWIGLSTKHLNRPNQSFNDNISRLPVQWDLHAGYKIPLVRHEYSYYLEDARDISLTPVVNYKAQGKSDQLDAGLYLIYDQLLLGLYYRGLPWIKRYQSGLQNNEAVIPMIGWNYKGLTVSYSYDITVSKLSGYTAGAHEFNLTYIFFKRHKYGHKPMKRLPCPSLHHQMRHF